MKKIIFVLFVTIGLFSCEVNSTENQRINTVTYTPVIVKKKYSENDVTKDLVFGTGNWHKTKYYIVDEKNGVWTNITRDNFIICDVGDTLWSDGWSLSVNK